MFYFDISVQYGLFQVQHGTSHRAALGVETGEVEVPWCRQWMEEAAVPVQVPNCGTETPAGLKPPREISPRVPKVD